MCASSATAQKRLFETSVEWAPVILGTSSRQQKALDSPELRTACDWAGGAL